MKIKDEIGWNPPQQNNFENEDYYGAHGDQFGIDQFQPNNMSFTQFNNFTQIEGLGITADNGVLGIKSKRSANIDSRKIKDQIELYAANFYTKNERDQKVFAFSDLCIYCDEKGLNVINETLFLCVNFQCKSKFWRVEQQFDDDFIVILPN